MLDTKDEQQQIDNDDDPQDETQTQVRFYMFYTLCHTPL